jgi:arginine decarboxylase
MLNMNTTPLLDALAKATARRHTPFYAPGHKQGQGISPRLQTLLGPAVFRADLPELPELDNLFAPTGPILAAQQLAAVAFGAEATHFLANGSTCGIEAAILAVCAPGDQVLVPRNAHRSVLAGLVLSGAQPVYLAPVHNHRWDLAFGLTAEQIEQALVAYPDIQAVVVVSPSYQGVCADILAIAHVVHAHNAVLIVDEAHGAHLSFHEQLPPGAIAGGADLVIQSTHKVLAALTQASMLHVQGPRVNRDRLSQALQLTQSTSPNYWLLASLDAARQQMATGGQALLSRTLDIADQVRSRLGNLHALSVLSASDIAAVSDQFQIDPTRLVVDVSALGLSGFAADDFLHTHLRVTAELPTLRQLTFMLSLGNTEMDGDRLVTALQTLSEGSPTLALDVSAPPPWPVENLPPISIPAMTPRDAFFAPSRTVSLTAAIGQLSADTLCPYPPGIPLVLPGEAITAEAIAQLQSIHQTGGVITGSPDAHLQTLTVVDRPT